MFENFSLIDLGMYLGIMALITVIVDLLKAFGVIKQPEMGKKVAGLIQTGITVVLWVVGMFFPEWLSETLPFIDTFAAMLAEIGAGLLALIPVIIALGQLVHDKFSEVPVLNKLSHSVD